MINKMVSVNNHGLIKQFIKVNTKMEKNTEKENSCGLMIVHMKVNFSKIAYRVMVDMSGEMVECM